VDHEKKSAVAVFLGRESSEKVFEPRKKSKRAGNKVTLSKPIKLTLLVAPLGVSHPYL